MSFRNCTLRQKSVLRVSVSICLIPTCYELLFNYLPEIIVHILLTSNCFDSSSPDNSSGVVLIPLMSFLMYQSQGNAPLCCRTGKKKRQVSATLPGRKLDSQSYRVCAAWRCSWWQKSISEMALVFDLVCGGEAVEGFGTILTWKAYPQLGGKCDYESVMFKPCM